MLLIEVDVEDGMREKNEERSKKEKEGGEEEEEERFEGEGERKQDHFFSEVSKQALDFKVRPFLTL